MLLIEERFEEKEEKKMSVQQLSVFVENKRGGLAEVTHALAQNHINILALSIADTTDYGVLRMIVDLSLIHI